MQIVLRILILLLLTASSALPVIRYVDNNSPGGNDGLSWATAWDHPLQISGVGGGDTVYISGGTTSKTYTFPSWWDVPNGNSSAQLVISAGLDAGHTGIVIFNMQTDALAGLQYVTFDFWQGGIRKLEFAGSGNGLYVYDDNNSVGFKLRGAKFPYAAIRMYDSRKVEIGWCHFNSTSTFAIPSNGPGWMRGLGRNDTTGYGNNSVHDCIFDLMYQHGVDETGQNGDDAMQNCAGSIDIYNNIFISRFTTGEPGNNHQDMIQQDGTYIRIWGNYFENSANYCIFGEFFQGGVGNWQIFNNVFNYSDPVLTAGPSQAIAIGSHVANTAYFNIYIFNNTFQGGDQAIALGDISGCTINDSWVVNNFKLNSGGFNVNRTSGNVVVSNNASAVSSASFVNAAAGNFHLTSAATNAINQGTTSVVSGITGVDKDGVSRGAVWDLGAYEFAASVGPGIITLASASYSTPEGTNVVITANRINGSSGAVGCSYTTTGNTATEGTDYTDASGNFSWADGDASAKTATVTVAQDAAAEGNESFNFIIASPTGGATLGSITSATVSIVDDEVVLPPLMPGLTFEAEAGLYEAPFSESPAGYISQSVDTNLPGSGRLRFRVTIPSTGPYRMTMLMNCANTGADSIFVNWDAEPTDPTMIFDVGVTAGPETKTLTWRGTGGPGTPEFSPKFFTLTAGVHELIIRGREPNALLGFISVIAESAVDTTPPNPPLWEIDPTAPGGSPGQTRLTMTATAVSDPSGPVEYFFDETSGGLGANDSGWQQSRTYTDDGLTPNTTYTYRVKARDSVGNESSLSTVGTGTTNPPISGGATINASGLIVFSHSSSPFGVMTHFAQTDPTTDFPLITAAGIENIRDEHYWDQIETTTPGVFTYPSKFTSWMAAASANSITPLMVLDWGNALYETSHGQFTAPYTTAGRDGYSAYALELLNHYPALQAVEVWNEYNASTFIQGPATANKPLFYKQMLQDVYETIKPTHPSVAVIAGATVPVAHGFFQSIFTEGAMPYLDAVSIHPYTTVEGAALDITELRELIKANNGGIAKPIWVTEFSRSTSSDADRVASAVYTAQFAVTLLSVGVAKMFYYPLLDSAAFPFRGLLGVSPTFTQQPPYFAYKTVISKLDDWSYVDRYALSAGTYAYRFRKLGVDRVAIWASEPMVANINTTFPLVVTDINGTATTMNPVAGVVELSVTDSIQYLDGTIASITEKTNPLLAGSLSGYSKTQGTNGWSYGYLTPPYASANFTPMTWGIWQSDNYRWIGPATFNFVSDLNSHPDSRWAIRRWTSTYAGTVTLKGDISRGSGGDGVNVNIFVDGANVYTQAISPSQSVSYNVPGVTLTVGSKVDFCVDQGAANNTNDATSFSAEILK